MKKSGDKPIVYVVDDDADFHALLSRMLSNLGMSVEIFLTPEQFLKKLKKQKPQLCIVDLNIARAGVGYVLIQAIRSVMGSELPIVMVSSIKDSRSIAHAIELGANDFIPKPVDPDILASKLRTHVSSDQLKAGGLRYFRVPDKGSPAIIDVELQVTVVEELGLRVISPHLLGKGTVVKLGGETMEEITGEPGGVLVRISSTWIEADGQTYGGFAEFDDTNDKLLRSVRRWLVSNT